MKKAAWCLGVLLFALSAGAQTFEPPFQLKAQRIVVAPRTTWNADKTTEIRPTGNVVIKLAKMK